MTFLDSDIFTLAFRGHPKVAPRAEQAIARNEVAVPIFVRGEALRGRIDALQKAATADDVLRMQQNLYDTEAYLARFPIIAFDEVAGRHFDRLVGLKGVKKMGRADLLIACIALAHDATLNTRNVKHFDNVPDLKLDNWAA